MLGLMLVFPPAVRSRRLCWFWYQRPQVQPEGAATVEQEEAYQQA